MFNTAMQVDYQEITQEEAKDITGGNWLSDAIVDAAADLLRRLMGPNV